MLGDWICIGTEMTFELGLYCEQIAITHYSTLSQNQTLLVFFIIVVQTRDGQRPGRTSIPHQYFALQLFAANYFDKYALQEEDVYLIHNTNLGGL